LWGIVGASTLLSSNTPAQDAPVNVLAKRFPTPSIPPSAPAPWFDNGGSLMVVGGGKLGDKIYLDFLDLARKPVEKGKNPKIVVITTASESAGKPADRPYIQLLTKKGATVGLFHVPNRAQADDEVLMEKEFKDVTGVWMTGGDQSRLMAAYAGTAVLRELKRVLERGGVIAGTSAGASIQGGMMPTGGDTEADVEVGDAFGLAPDMIVDQHFAKRNRFGRMAKMKKEYPGHEGLAVDESTAAIYRLREISKEIAGEVHDMIGKKSREVTVVGSGNAYHYKRKKGDQSDILKLKDGDTVYLDLPALPVSAEMLPRAEKRSQGQPMGKSTD
jgi:cyanophycinase